MVDYRNPQTRDLQSFDRSVQRCPELLCRGLAWRKLVLIMAGICMGFGWEDGARSDALPAGATGLLSEEGWKCLPAEGA